LLDDPSLHVVQGSPEWFESRRNLITASNIGAILGAKGCFMSANEYCAQLCGWKKPLNEFAMEAMKYGNDLESEIREWHEHQIGEKIYEFGCKRHEQLPWLGGSPDGITESGILCEYKAPFKKHVDENTLPTEQYVCQVQVLMEIFDLESCHFIWYLPPSRTGTSESIAYLHIIKRDREWFKSIVPKLLDFWNMVLDYKSTGKWMELLSKKRSRTPEIDEALHEIDTSWMNLRSAHDVKDEFYGEFRPIIQAQLTKLFKRQPAFQAQPKTKICVLEGTGIEDPTESALALISEE